MTCTECHPTHDCSTTVSQLVDVAVRSGLAFSTAALSCCSSLKAPTDCGCTKETSTTTTTVKAAAAKRVVHSDQFPTRRIETQRQLTLEKPLSTGYLTIPPERVTLQPFTGRDPQHSPLGVLGPTENTFHLELDATGLPGAVYQGTVRVRALNGSSDELVEVFIEL